MVLSLCAVLPLNLTGNCEKYSATSSNSTNYATCPVTDYERTTTANLPTRELDVTSSWGEIQFRPAAMCLFIWVMTMTVCRILWLEWVENLKVRRKYYLEADHYGSRTCFDRDIESMGESEETRFLKNRRTTEPWVADPEQHETAPSVELYSVLVGNLPLKPAEIVNPSAADRQGDQADDIYNIINTIPTTEWQLAMTAAMFDRAVPGEEYYTSSVAAVSILPDPECLAKSWRKWYSSIGAQRQLKYVRQLLYDRGYGDSEGLKEMGNRDLTDPFSVIDHHGKAQTAMYSRELAQSSSMCCPLGCNEGKYKSMPTTELIDIESELLEVVLMASHSLKKTQNITIAKQNHEEEVQLSEENEIEVTKKKKKRRSKKATKNQRKLTDEINLAKVFDKKDEYLPNNPLKSHHKRSHTMANLGSTVKPKHNRRHHHRARTMMANNNLGPGRGTPPTPYATHGKTGSAIKRRPQGEYDDYDSRSDTFDTSSSNSGYSSSSVDAKKSREGQTSTRARPSAIMRQHMADFHDGLELTESPEKVEVGCGEEDRPIMTLASSPLLFESKSKSKSKFKSSDSKASKYSKGSKSTSSTEHSKSTSSTEPSSASSSNPIRRLFQSSEKLSNVTVRKNKIYHPDAKFPIQIDLPALGNHGRAKLYGDARRRKGTPNNASKPGGQQQPRRSSIFILPSPRKFDKQTNFEIRGTGSGLRSPSDNLSLRASFSKVLGQQHEHAPQSSARRRSSTTGDLLGEIGNVSGGCSDDYNTNWGGRARLLSNDSVAFNRSVLDEEEGTLGNDDGKDAAQPAIFNLTTDGILLAQPRDLLGSNQPSEEEEIRHDENGGRWELNAMKNFSPTHYVRGCWDGICVFFKSVSEPLRKCCKSRTMKKLANEDFLSKGGSFAAVTFVSRQAAASARNCNIDGRGTSRWYTQTDLPVTPLSDAAPFDLKTCRNCCRPVTLTLNRGQKKTRMYLGYFCLFIVYTMYTVPIAEVAEITTNNIDGITRFLFGDEGFEAQPAWVKNILLGFFPAVLQSLFFSIAPYLFKSISNFGSGSTSLNEAERHTLKYYWGFMLVTCFTGSFLATITVNLFNFGNTGNLFYNTTASQVVQEIAFALPTTSSAVWLNWILVRTFIVIPLQYLFQFNAHLFRFLRLKCCARCAQGGGMGGPIPFRVYVDSSVVLLCALTFCVISPLVLPCAFIYFLVTVPLWRRQLLLVYRPMFDAGGMRWPFLFNVVMSALYLSQMLVGLVLLLKNMYTPSILTFLTTVLTIDFHLSCNRRFRQAYFDIGLMQSGLINESNKSKGILQPRGLNEDIYNEKEDFRKWLVDAHLAAFIPICMLDNLRLVETLTAAPAQTILPHGGQSDANGAEYHHSDSGYDTDTDEDATAAADEDEDEDVNEVKAKIHRRSQTLKDMFEGAPDDDNLPGSSKMKKRKGKKEKRRKKKKKEKEDKIRWIDENEEAIGSQSRDSDYVGVTDYVEGSGYVQGLSVVKKHS